MSTRAEVKAAYEKALLRNLNEARECGYDLACPVCGAGITDDSDMHDDGAHLLHAALHPTQETAQ